jgi:hypothetical protein
MASLAAPGVSIIVLGLKLRLGGQGGVGIGMDDQGCGRGRCGLVRCWVRKGSSRSRER